MNRVKAAIALITLSAIAAGSVPAIAAAAPLCARQPQVNVLVGGRGILESIGIDRRGRLFFTDSTSGELLMLRRPGGEPKVIVDGIDGTGGIVFRRDGKLLVGFGNGIEQASDGTSNPEAGLLKVDPATGDSEIWVEGLQMANGVTRGPGRTIFASNDIAGGVDRVRHRTPELNWAAIETANGMVADHDFKTLFVNQTFTAATIQRVPFDDPAAAEPWFAAAPADAAAGFDGLTRDGQDRLYAAANGAGQVWRIDGPGQACVLADRDPFPSGPSDLAFGRKHTNFSAKNLYVTTFGGELLELVNAR